MGYKKIETKFQVLVSW